MLVLGGQYTFAVMHNAETGTANGIALDTFSASNGAAATAAFQLTGIDGETVTWEATIDGSTWVAIAVENLATNAFATTTNANGIFRVTCHGLRKIRGRISTGGSGAVTLVGVAAT